MAERFHFNPETGRTGKCGADPSNPRSSGCRFGQSEGQHGATREEARANYEAKMAPELFSNTQAKGSEALSSSERKRLQESILGDPLKTAGIWSSDTARVAAIRSELSEREIDSSRFSAAQLRGAHIYLTNRWNAFSPMESDRVERLYKSDAHAERDLGELRQFSDKLLKRNDLQQSALEKVRSGNPIYDEQLQAIAKGMELEKSGHYPVPVERSNRFNNTELNEEEADIQRETGSSVMAILLNRKVDETDLNEAEIEHDGWISVKAPGSVGVEISTELARRELASYDEFYGSDARRR